jgi:hypothetical protein
MSSAAYVPLTDEEAGQRHSTWIQHLSVVMETRKHVKHQTNKPIEINKHTIVDEKELLGKKSSKA